MKTSTEQPPNSHSPSNVASPSRARRRRSAPRGRRGIGVHWHRRGEWRSVVTGGVATPRARSTRGAWTSFAAIAAVGVIAGAAIGAGAMRLGWLPATGATPIVLAALVLAASGAIALLACCAEIDSVVDREREHDHDREREHDLTHDTLTDRDGT